MLAFPSSFSHYCQWALKKKLKEISNQNINRYLNKVKYSYNLGAFSVQLQHNQEVKVKEALPYKELLIYAVI